jgi:hypothetical protein
MTHDIVTRDFGFGLTLWTVRVGNVVASGTAPATSRPTAWTVTNVRRSWALGRVSPADVRGSTLLNARALAKAMHAVETGRV